MPGQCHALPGQCHALPGQCQYHAGPVRWLALATRGPDPPSAMPCRAGLCGPFLPSTARPRGGPCSAARPSAAECALRVQRDRRERSRACRRRRVRRLGPTPSPGRSHLSRAERSQPGVPARRHPARRASSDRPVAANVKARCTSLARTKARTLAHCRPGAGGRAHGARAQPRTLAPGARRRADLRGAPRVAARARAARVGGAVGGGRGVVPALRGGRRPRVARARRAHGRVPERDAGRRCAGGASQRTVPRGIPCRGIPCRGIPCRGIPCRGIPCRGIPCRGIPCRGIPCRGIPCRGIPCRAGSHAVRDPMLCGIPCCAGYDAVRDTMLWDTMPWDTMLWDTMVACSRLRSGAVVSASVAMGRRVHTAATSALGLGLAPPTSAPGLGRRWAVAYSVGQRHSAYAARCTPCGEVCGAA
jgi:hypothetical protein